MVLAAERPPAPKRYNLLIESNKVFLYLPQTGEEGHG